LDLLNLKQAEYSELIKPGISLKPPRVVVSSNNRATLTSESTAAAAAENVEINKPFALQKLLGKFKLSFSNTKNLYIMAPLNWKP